MIGALSSIANSAGGAGRNVNPFVDPVGGQTWTTPTIKHSFQVIRD
jgi:hypothetical protein